MDTANVVLPRGEYNVILADRDAFAEEIDRLHAAVHACVKETRAEAREKLHWMSLAAKAMAENERLREALRSCADRFERCIIATGTDHEHAASAVKRYRDLLK